MRVDRAGQPRQGEVQTSVFEALGLSNDCAHGAMAVVAHPDDETIGLGGVLADLPEVVILHVTDGAPRDMRDAAAHGFVTRADYAQARRRELAAALSQAGVEPRDCVSLGVADQEAAQQLVSLSRRLVGLFAQYRPGAVFTHAYEGGHPDHDATAFAAHAACRLLAAQGERPPALIEMPLYRSQDGQMVAQIFAPEPLAPAHAAPLSRRAALVKRNMFDCFVTQQSVLARFRTDVEWFRRAPDYDFTRLPNGGDLNYERFSWGFDGASWLKLAAAALAELGLASCR